MNKNNFICILLKLLKKGVGSWVWSRSGSTSQRYGSGTSPKCQGSLKLPLLDIAQNIVGRPTQGSALLDVPGQSIIACVCGGWDRYLFCWWWRIPDLKCLPHWAGVLFWVFPAGCLDSCPLDQYSAFSTKELASHQFVWVLTGFSTQWWQLFF